MTTRRLRRVLLGCAVSNAVIAVAGLAAVSQPATAISTAAASPQHASVLDESASAPAVTAPPTTAVTAPPVTAPVTTTKQIAPTTPRKRASTATTAAAADDTSGMVSSAAPSDPSRIAPDAGSYPATFSGSANVDGSGQRVPSSGSMVFAAVGGDLRQSSPGTPGNVQLTQRYVSNETDLVSLQLKAGSLNKTITPSSPVAFLRYDSPAGTSWTWSATSTDGKTHVSATGTVGSGRTVNVGGVDVATTQTDMTITISGDITGTAHITTWVSPVYRLPVIQRQQINAKQSVGSGFSSTFTSDITTTLTSLSPS